MRREILTAGFGALLAACNGQNIPQTPPSTLAPQIAKATAITGHNAITLIEGVPPIAVAPNQMACQKIENPRLAQLEGVIKRNEGYDGDHTLAEKAKISILREGLQHDVACCINIEGNNTMCWKGPQKEMKQVAKENIVSITEIKRNGNERQVRIALPSFLQQGYKDVTLEEWWDYAISNFNPIMDSAEAAGMFVQGVINAQKISPNGKNIIDQLLPEQIFENDHERANALMVELLSRLHYKPKVIGLGGTNHTIVIFKESEDEWKAFDGKMPLLELQKTGKKSQQYDLYSASPAFNSLRPNSKDKAPRFFEIGRFTEYELENNPELKGVKFYQTIDPKTLEPDYSELTIMTGSSGESYFHPTDYETTTNAKAFRKLRVIYTDRIIIFENGEEIEDTKFSKQ